MLRGAFIAKPKGKSQQPKVEPPEMRTVQCDSLPRCYKHRSCRILRWKAFSHAASESARNPEALSQGSVGVQELQSARIWKKHDLQSDRDLTGFNCSAARCARRADIRLPTEWPQSPPPFPVP